MSDAAAPALSVVVPTRDHRGHIVESLSSWTRGQTLARERYEVLVVDDGGDPAITRTARGLLGPGDRLLAVPGADEPALHDHGARAAHGAVVLFTEAHCVAEPGCLSALQTYLESHRSELAGACLTTVDDGNPHPIARIEARAYQEGFAAWSQPGDWRKVTIRGTAVRRDAYLGVGGFDAGLGVFSEMALAAELDAAGHRLGHAAAARITHYNSTAIADMLDYVAAFRDGEVRYRARVPAARFDAYFGWGADWAEAGAAERRLAFACARASLARGLVAMVKGRSGALARSMAAVLAERAGDALAFGRIGVLRAGVAYAAARARFARPGLDAEERYRRFQVLWNAAGRRGFERALRRARAGGGGAAAAPALLYRPGELASDALCGFHARERHEGRSFRWAGPLALLRVQVPAGDHMIALDTGGLSALRVDGFDVYLDGARVQPAAAQDGRFLFHAPRALFAAEGARTLVIAAPRLRAVAPAEHRALGLPLFAVEFRPI
ncbi:MAG: glycosyltransferase [Candidatus Odyssella sp.]|nr:glycosyltransferase [Candidatus Odyssella sp.]